MVNKMLKKQAMLCKAADEPSNDAEWVHEVKLDGERCLAWVGTTATDLIPVDELTEATVHTGSAHTFPPQLFSRLGTERTAKYPEIVRALASQKTPMLLDGEIIARGQDDNSDFSKLFQRSQRGGKPSDAAKEPRIPLEFHVFDILNVNGRNVTQLPLDERRKLLVESVDENAGLKVSPQYPRGIDLFERMLKEGQEGIVSKRRDGIYEPGKRHWLKVKAMYRDEFVIGGVTLGDGKRQGKLGAILIGAHNASGELDYFGMIGTGISTSILDTIWERLTFDQEGNPFVGGWDRKIEPDDPVFVVPEVVVQTSYKGISKDGRLRSPRFLGLREDKEASDVMAPADVTQHGRPRRQRYISRAQYEGGSDNS